MCAINGFNWKDQNLILKMNEVTQHRGPDGTNIFLNDQITLGHNRLSIIDLSNEANQPMKSSDEKLVISFNGEIYNFRELKNELSNFYEFKTKSDTEVILASYRKWGKECVEYFNGIFSFVIWDEERRELFLARDHAGIKPFYYYLENGKFIFSSEIKAILTHNIERKISEKALSLYLHLLYTPEPYTMFEGINKFPASSRAIFKNNTLSIETYKLKEFSKKIDPSYVNLQTTIDEAVERQMISDRPVGVYLSGGIDSTVIADALSRTHNNIDTFSVGFDLREDEDREKFNADFFLARQTSKYYKTNHHEVMISAEEALSLFERAVINMDEPVSNPTEIAMLKLASFAKRKVAVVLSGEGGDELFGGYERYRLSAIANLYSLLPKFIRNVLSIFKPFEKANIPRGIKRLKRFMFQKDNVLKEVIKKGSLFSDEITESFFKEKFAPELENKDFENSLMKIDQKTWLIDEALLRSDKMSMAYGLEVRVPFLDAAVINFSDNLPTSKKVSLVGTKIALKEAYKERLPKFILNQPKRGWFSPAAKWLRHPEFIDFAKEVLSPNYYEPTSSIFNWEGVNSMLTDHVEKKRYNLNTLWSLLTFQIWAKHYKVRHKDL